MLDIILIFVLLLEVIVNGSSGERGQLYTGASCYRVVLRKHCTHMEIPPTVVGWKSTNRHTIQKSGVKKTKLTRCEKNTF